MNKLIKITSLFCAFAFVFFCFSGCSFSLTGPGGPVNNPLITRFNNHMNVIEWITGDDDNSSAPTLSYEGKQNLLNEYAEEMGINAVRTLSVPVAGTTTSYAQTDSERARFYSNVIEQYEVVAKYILTNLVGHFGMGHNLTEVTSSVYNLFYTELRTTGDYSLAIQPAMPEDRSATYSSDTDVLVIDKVVVGWSLSASEGDIEDPLYNSLTGYQCDLHHIPTPVYSTDYAWNLNLSDQNITDANAYLDAYLQKYLQFVTMRLMEIDLQLPATPFQHFDPSTLKQKFLNYITENKVVKLGLNLDSRKGAIENFINTEIIGDKAIIYNNATKNFAEPSFTSIYKHKTGETDPDTGEELTEDITITHYADINKNLRYDGLFSVASSAGFHSEYDLVVSETISYVAEKVKEFPNVFAMEVTDFTPEQFYNIGQKAADGQVQVLTNLPYAQYQSVAFLCENNWQFDTLYLAIGANTNFVLKTYLRVVVDGVENIVHIANVNVDNESSWTYVGEQEHVNTSNLTDSEIIELSKKQNLDAETKRNFLGIDLSTMLTEEQLKLIINQQKNSQNLTTAQYQTATANNRLGYHTNVADNTSLSPVEDSNVLNVNDEQTYIRKQLSEGNKQFALNNKNSTFFEILFEIEDATEVCPFNCLVWTEFFGGFA